MAGISPKKTVEGFIGGIVGGLIVAVLFALFSDINLPFMKLMIITIVLSIFGQLGDLAQSALKRHYGVKDSGNIMPGMEEYLIDVIAGCLFCHYYIFFM